MNAPLTSPAGEEIAAARPVRSQAATGHAGCGCLWFSSWPSFGPSRSFVKQLDLPIYAGFFSSVRIGRRVDFGLHCLVADCGRRRLRDRFLICWD